MNIYLYEYINDIKNNYTIIIITFVNALIAFCEK